MASTSRLKISCQGATPVQHVAWTYAWIAKAAAIGLMDLSPVAIAHHWILGPCAKPRSHRLKYPGIQRGRIMERDV